MIRNVLRNYELIASEYYDAKLHPTCTNFREASRLLLVDWLEKLSSKTSFVEVGPGKSLVAEIFAAGNGELSRLVLVDSSPSMLGYSRSWGRAGVHLVQAEAEMLPLTSKSSDLIVSSLGDSYNNSRFWREVCRVLRPDGIVIFTTPSYDWASKLRADKSQENKLTAEFVLSNGQVARIPSIIYAPEKQVHLMNEQGLVVVEMEQIPISAIANFPLSPRLCVERGFEAAIVTGYLARKPC